MYSMHVRFEKYGTRMYDVTNESNLASILEILGGRLSLLLRPQADMPSSLD
jgi:hypothetical protein